MTEGSQRGPPQQTAEILASYIPVEERLTVYQRVFAWEERLEELRASCLAVASVVFNCSAGASSRWTLCWTVACALQFRSYKRLEDF